MPDDTLALLEIIGLRPVMVNRLGRDAALYLRDGVLLIDSRITGDRLTSIVDQALMAAAEAIRR